jgi:hypothetical protein
LRSAELCPGAAHHEGRAGFFIIVKLIDSCAKHLQTGFTLSAQAAKDLFSPLGLVGMASLIPACILIAAGLVSGLMKHSGSPLLWATLACGASRRPGDGRSS